MSPLANGFFPLCKFVVEFYNDTKSTNPLPMILILYITFFVTGVNVVSTVSEAAPPPATTNNYFLAAGIVSTPTV